MKVFLVNPPRTYQVWAGVPDIFNGPDAYLFPPLGIMYLASYLRERTGHDVELLDCVERGYSAERAAKRIAAADPDLLGVSASTHNLVNVVEVIREAKKLLPDLFTIIGGSHVTSFPEEAARLPGIDAAVRGDGEEPLAALLDRLESGAAWRDLDNLCYMENGAPVLTGHEEPHSDLDRFPFPDRSLLPLNRYYTPGMKAANATTIITSRGCPYRCTFCSVPHNYRARSAANIADELEYCSRELGIREFHFIDDIFNITPERVIEVSETILERNLDIYWGFKAGCTSVTKKMLAAAKRAGCIRLHFGVETWSDKGLEMMGKKARLADIRAAFKKTGEAGIRAIAYLIIGCPHEKTAADVERVVPFVKSLRPDYAVFSLYTPYPDTPSFEEGVNKGLWKTDCWTRFMRNPRRDFDLPTIWDEFIDRKTQVALLKKVHNRFYFSPPYMARTLLSMRTAAELKRLVQGGLILLKLQSLKAFSRRI